MDPWLPETAGGVDGVGEESTEQRKAKAKNKEHHGTRAVTVMWSVTARSFCRHRLRRRLASLCDATSQRGRLSAG
jgi:hypothetical protein